LAGFQVSIIGRFWVSTEVPSVLDDRKRPLDVLAHPDFREALRAASIEKVRAVWKSGHLPPDLFLTAPLSVS